MRDNQPRWLAATLVVLVMLLSPARGQAQGGLSLLEDASLVPRGMTRLRMPVIWTRYEQRFGSSALTPLGAPFTSDSLGAAQLLPLTSTQALIQTAAGSPIKLSLGKSSLSAMAREEQMNFAFEYGLLDRLSLSFVLPVVRKRLSGLFRLDSAGSNVGPNPNRITGGTALVTNNQVQAEFGSAASQLQNRLNACTASPGSAGCPALLARQAEAQSLIQSSQSFAGTVATLYGETGSSGEAFVPRLTSPAQAAVAARVADFNLKYKDLLASSSDIITAVPAGAAGPAGVANVNNYWVNELGRDSLDAGELLGVGDVELGFKFLAIDRPIRERGAVGMRLILGSSVRFPSGSRQAPVSVMDMRIADGAIGFDARAIGEIQRGRVAVLGAATFTSVGVDKAMPPSDTRRVSLDVEPRWNLTAPLSIHGSYSLRTADFTGNTQLVGGGVTFASISTWQPGSRPLPMEMRYSHLETISGAVGAARFTRDQLEVRIYYQRGR